jgi:hypothetical protein
MKLPDLDLHRKLNRARDEVEARLALDVDKFWEPPPRKERDPFDAQMLKPHLSKGQLRDMYRRRRQGETVLAIAAVYNLSEHRTCAILRGVTAGRARFTTRRWRRRVALRPGNRKAPLRAKTLREGSPGRDSA